MKVHKTDWPLGQEEIKMVKLIALVGLAIVGLAVLGWVSQTYHNQLMNSGVILCTGVFMGLVLKGK